MISHYSLIFLLVYVMLLNLECILVQKDLLTCQLPKYPSSHFCNTLGQGKGKPNLKDLSKLIVIYGVNGNCI